MTPNRALPPSWSWASFKEVATVASNLVDPAKHQDLPHIAPNHIESRTGRLLPYTTVAEDGVTSPKHLFHRGQILYSKIRPYLAKVVEVQFDGLCSADMYPIDTTIVPRFLFYWLLTPEFTQFASHVQGRTVLPKINQGQLYALPVPVAPLHEQRRIVAAIEKHFSRLDAGETALQSSQTKLRLMRRALLHSAVTGKLIGATTDGWRIATLGELVTDIHAGKSFKCEERPAQPDEWGVIKVSAMTWGEFLEQENKTVLPGREIDKRMEIREGDLLVSRANTVDYVGAVVLVQKTRPRLLLSDKSLRLVPSSAVLPEWLVITLRSPEARRYIEGVATGTSDSMRNISQPKLRALQVPLPPIDVQRELVAEVARHSAVIVELDSTIKRQLARANRLRSSILADAYAGRLVSHEPSDRSPAQLHPLRAANHVVETGVVA